MFAVSGHCRLSRVNVAGVTLAGHVDYQAWLANTGLMTSGGKCVPP